MNEVPGTTENPTVPIGADITWIIMVLVYFILTIAALVSIFRTRHDRAASKFWWSALVIVIPLVGAAAWFPIGSTSHCVDEPRPTRARSRRTLARYQKPSPTVGWVSQQGYGEFSHLTYVDQTVPATVLSAVSGVGVFSHIHMA